MWRTNKEPDSGHSCIRCRHKKLCSWNNQLTACWPEQSTLPAVPRSGARASGWRLPLRRLVMVAAASAGVLEPALSEGRAARSLFASSELQELRRCELSHGEWHAAGVRFRYSCRWIAQMGLCGTAAALDAWWEVWAGDPNQGYFGKSSDRDP
jgi:hypothetical protein